jgi:hypothetical protein
MNECTAIPIWFIALAVYGAMSLVAFPGFWFLHHVFELWIQKDEPATYVQQVKRPLFLRGRYGR